MRTSMIWVLVCTAIAFSIPASEASPTWKSAAELLESQSHE